MAADYFDGAKSKIERRTIFLGTKIAGDVFIELAFAMSWSSVTLLIATKRLSSTR